jgi:hypothetical protein
VHIPAPEQSDDDDTGPVSISETVTMGGGHD